MRPELDQEVVSALVALRADFNLRWNPKAVLVKEGSWNADGSLARAPEYEPRWEFWEKAPQTGQDCYVMRLQHKDGSFRQPGMWLIEAIQRMNPERHDALGMIEAAEILREIGTEKDSDDMIEMLGNWADYVATPKSYSGQKYRGQVIKSGR